MPIDVNQRSKAVEEMALEWPMLEALQGTRQMRAASTQLMPKWPAEESDAYQARLSSATLFPAYRRTVSVMAGKPFSKPLTLDASDQIKAWAQDIDRQGTSLHVFASEMFEEVMNFGVGGILIDYPKADPQSTRTVADVQAAGLRPYWVRYKHDQILGWQTETVNGAVRLKQLRLSETYEEPDGPYGTKDCQQVRVLYPGGWQVWRAAGDKGAWEIFDEGVTTLNAIPFVPLYGIRKGFMQGKPPLLDLAYLNVKHWQSQSDQDTILHVARVPILAMKCVEGKDGQDVDLKIGASSAVDLGSNKDATLFFVEHSGVSIEAGQKSLEALTDQMVETGAELLVKRTVGNVSATGEAKDAEANKSDLQRIAEVYQDSLNQALQITADWVGEKDGGTVKLFSDYGAATLSDASAQLIRDLQAAGLISKETAIAEFKRRGVLSETVDAQDEAEKVEQEGPALGTMTDGLGGGDAFGQ